MGKQVWSLHSVTLTGDQKALSNCKGFQVKMIPGQA